MIEVCFCGWTGAVTDKTPAYLGDGQWGLTCPGCGRADDLSWLPYEAALPTFALACERHERASASGSAPAVLPRRPAGQAA
jgi:hypothetical protein